VLAGTHAAGDGLADEAGTNNDDDISHLDILKVVQSPSGCGCVKSWRATSMFVATKAMSDFIVVYSG
jgi:hypothetical protein